MFCIYPSRQGPRNLPSTLFIEFPLRTRLHVCPRDLTEDKRDIVIAPTENETKDVSREMTRINCNACFGGRDQSLGQ